MVLLLILKPEIVRNNLSLTVTDLLNQIELNFNYRKVICLMKKSSLSSQTTIPKISKIDYSKDALRHEKYSKLCTDLGQCLEVST